MSGEDVDEVIKALIEDEEADSVRSLSEAAVPPHWMCTLEKDGSIKRYVESIHIGDAKYCLRQSVPKVYEIFVMAYAIWTKTILDTDTLFGKNVKGVVFGREKSLDIDSPLDLEIARAIMKKHRKGK